MSSAVGASCAQNYTLVRPMYAWWLWEKLTTLDDVINLGVNLVMVPSFPCLPLHIIISRTPLFPVGCPCPCHLSHIWDNWHRYMVPVCPDWSLIELLNGMTLLDTWSNCWTQTFMIHCTMGPAVEIDIFEICKSKRILHGAISSHWRPEKTVGQQM